MIFWGWRVNCWVGNNSIIRKPAIERPTGGELLHRRLIILHKPHSRSKIKENNLCIYKGVNFKLEVQKELLAMIHLWIGLVVVTFARSWIYR